MNLLHLRARWYDVGTGTFLSRDAVESEPAYQYVRGNPVNLTDSSGLCSEFGDDTCWTVYDILRQKFPSLTTISYDHMGSKVMLHQLPERRLRELLLNPPLWSVIQDFKVIQGSVEARVFYLNAIGNAGGNVFAPSSNPGNEQGYILYIAGQLAGPENVIHIPVYKGTVFTTRLQMFAEMFECRVWSDIVADEITKNIEANPLGPNEKLILVGNSGGGTLAIETLDLLKERGIFVDKAILRGSPVREWELKNVGEVDYITSNFDYYYSFDNNPFDAVSVQEYVVDFWGHVPLTTETRKEIAHLIAYLIAN